MVGGRASTGAWASPSHTTQSTEGVALNRKGNKNELLTQHNRTGLHQNS